MWQNCMNNMVISKIRSKAIKVLLSSRIAILNHLRKIVTSGSFNYRTFGTDIEAHISDVLIKNFKKAGLIKNENDYILAPDKNYFPDLELKITPLAIEYKSGNKNKLSKGQWITTNNSNNDMGTFHKWPSKIKKFGGDNIYYVFVIYDFNNQIKKIIDIQIAPFYRFIGLNSNGLLKYREKDGNLRPKDFYADSPIKTFERFKELFNKTIIYRSKRIIKKHRLIIKKTNSDS